MVPTNKGLKRVSFWKRIHDRTHPSFFGTDQLPATLGRIQLQINDQGTSEFCTAFAISEAGGFLYELPMSSEWQTASEGEEAGAPIFNGTDPHTAMQAALDRGFLPETESPYSFALSGWIIPAIWQNYPIAMQADGAPYKPGSVYAVTPTYDGIKQALFDAKDDNGVVMAFGFWYASWNQAATTTSAKGLMTIGVTQTGRHAYVFIDWKTIDGTEYLVAQLSQGTTFGDGGLCYFSRDIVNAAFAKPILNGIGCYVFRSIADTKTQEIGLYQQAVSLLQEIVSLLSPKTTSISASKLSTLLSPLVPALERLEVELEDMDQTQTANGTKIYQEAKALLGTRVAPDNASTDYGILGCAATVNRIVQLALGAPVGGGASTYQLWQALQDAARYTPISEPLPGDIIVSPTGTNKYPTVMPNGHCGIVGQFGILSNSSETGTLQENYTLASWQSVFAGIGGFPVYFYRTN